MSIQKRQPEVNIGMVGHVDHGKTTLTYKLTGIWTDTHSEEIRRGITIKLGYANMDIYKCERCPEPDAYTNRPICEKCGSEAKYLRSVSFVDAPGHESLMAVMLSGAALMDGAILVIAANEACPKPQTKEHLMALKILNVRNIIVVQNKIDVVSKERAKENYGEIIRFLEQYDVYDVPIIPLSAQHDANIDVLIQAIQEFIPTPERDPSKPPIAYIVRSFDVNRPGTPVKKLVGGVLGGTLKQGILRVGDEIEIRPGIRVEHHGKRYWEPLYTEITSLTSGNMPLKEARPGGLVGIGTKLDPTLTKSDNMIGNVVGRPDELPPTLTSLELEIHLFKHVIGLEEEVKVRPLQVREPLMITVNTAVSLGYVRSVKGDHAEIVLTRPVVAEEGDRVAIGRRITDRWRLIGYGIIRGGS